MQNLNDMIVFAEVVECGSFTSAADKMDLPKSNISRKVARLEQALGVLLLQRTTRKLSLTEIGQIYFHHCQRIKEEIAEAEYNIARSLARPSGKLRLTASIGVGQHLLTPLLPAFKKRCPDVTVELELSNRRIDLLEEQFDAAIRVGELDDSTMVAKKLCTTKLTLWASPALLKQSKPATPEELADYPLLTMTNTRYERSWQLVSDATKYALQVEPAASSNDFSTLLTLACAGTGIAPLPDYIAAPAAADGKLVAIMPSWHIHQTDISLIFPSRRGVTPKLRALIEYLEEELGSKHPPKY